MHDDPCRAKVHDDRHPPCSSLWSHGTGRLRRKVSVVCGNLKMGAEWGQNSCVCDLNGCCIFRGPQVAASVEQVSEWISMWCGVNADTRRRLRKIWKEIASILSHGPISAANCDIFHRALVSCVIVSLLHLRTLLQGLRLSSKTVFAHLSSIGLHRLSASHPDSHCSGAELLLFSLIHDQRLVRIVQQHNELACSRH